MTARPNLKRFLTVAIHLSWGVIASGNFSAEGCPGLLIAGANGMGLSSADGKSFSPASILVQTNERSRCRGAGMVVRITQTGRLWTSRDGGDWSEADAGVPFGFHGIAFGKDRFVAVGNEGAILTSESGLAWSLQPSPTDER